MVDQKKRSTLKTLTAATAYASVPTIVGGALVSQSAAAASSPTGGYVAYHLDDASMPQGTGLDVEVEATTSYGATWVRFSNLSGEPVTVKHVSPGVVRSEGQLFDVNSVLDADGLTIEPKQAFAFIIEPVATDSAIRPTPRSKISLTTASIRGQDNAQYGDVLTPRLVLG